MRAHAVVAAIGSAQSRLKLWSKVPTNGLVIYCGCVLRAFFSLQALFDDNNCSTIDGGDGKNPKMIHIDFEPFKPINTSLYLCDNRFHVEPLGELLEVLVV